MTPGDAARVFGACALFDNRKMRDDEDGEMVARAWYSVIGDLELADALEAVRRHYRDSSEWMMPAHIRRGVAAIKAERRRAQPDVARELPSKFEEDVDKQVKTQHGIGPARSALAQVFETMALRNGTPGALSALEELRALTGGPAWTNNEDEEGVAQ